VEPSGGPQIPLQRVTRHASSKLQQIRAVDTSNSACYSLAAKARSLLRLGAVAGAGGQNVL
jgi:hypothetical protein